MLSLQRQTDKGVLQGALLVLLLIKNKKRKRQWKRKRTSSLARSKRWQL